MQVQKKMLSNLIDAQGTTIFSTWLYIVSIAAAICLSWTVVKRLFLSPIARFPGPKIAGATFWYEFYFDVVKRGRYFREIEKMHLKYGKQSLHPHRFRSWR